MRYWRMVGYWMILMRNRFVGNLELVAGWFLVGPGVGLLLGRLLFFMTSMVARSKVSE